MREVKSERFGKLKGDVVKKKVNIINFEKLGFNARYLFLVKADDSSREEVKEFLLNHSSVNSLHITNSDFDFLFEGVFKTMRDMERFKKNLESQYYILMTRHHQLIEDVAREKWSC